MVIHELPESEKVGIIVAGLRRGITYRTDVQRAGAGGSVYLQPGDETCSGCDTLIDADEYPGAPWHRILANQKKRYGHTMCRECHQEVKDA